MFRLCSVASCDVAPVMQTNSSAGNVNNALSITVHLFICSHECVLCLQSLYSDERSPYVILLNGEQGNMDVTWTFFYKYALMFTSKCVLCSFNRSTKETSQQPSDENYEPAKARYHPVEDACWKPKQKLVHWRFDAVIMTKKLVSKSNSSNNVLILKS